MFARTGPRGKPMVTPSICLNILHHPKLNCNLSCCFDQQFLQNVLGYGWFAHSIKGAILFPGSRVCPSISSTFHVPNVREKACDIQRAHVCALTLFSDSHSSNSVQKSNVSSIVWFPYFEFVATGARISTRHFAKQRY